MYGFLFFWLLLLVLIAAIPVWPHSRRWGYRPGILIMILLLGWVLLIYFGVIAITYPWDPGPAP